MAFKFIALYALITIIASVAGAPYHHHGGHDEGHDDGGYEHGGYEHGGYEHDGGHEDHGASSHQSVHLVSKGGEEHHGHEHEHHDEGHDDGGEYHFTYGVEDKKTGDFKGQSEKRDGHKVSGHYELIDADGHKRIVTYTADKHTGFQATVHREPTHHKAAESGHSFKGGKAHFEEASHHDEHGHGHEHGHEHHGHGSDTHTYSLKQEHAVAVHKHEHEHEHGHY